MAFQCVIVTPEQQALDESVTQAILPAHDGLIGILTDRAPLLVKLGLGPGRCIPLQPFLLAQNPGYKRVGQALRFCLSDLVKIKAVPARTCTANLLKLRQSCLLASIHRLVIRSSLSSRSAKSVASNALM